MFMAVFALFLSCVAPVWAGHTSDPLEESYAQHVLPYYNVGTGWLSYVIITDTSFADFAVTSATKPELGGDPIHFFFFDSTCLFRRDHQVTLTEHGVVVVSLTDPVLSGIPAEGVVFLDSGKQGVGSKGNVTNNSGGQGRRFLTYLILVNLTDNTLTRIDSIPFSPGLANATTGGPFTVIPGTGHWTRYDSWNTAAITLGDSTATTTLIGGLRTTMTFFSAIGGGGASAPVTASGNTCTAATPPCIVGEVDTLREFLGFYGFPRVGDWVTLGTSGTSDVGPGSISLFAFDGDENFLASAHFTILCILRLRLGSSTLFPILANAAGSFKLGHIVGFADAQASRSWCKDNQCAFSAFQETVLEGGTVDLTFSGYWHHSSHALPQPSLQ
jgi:hypothetical protein